MSLCCTVASLVPFEIREEKPGLHPGRFYIPASDMKIPQIIHVETAYHYVYLDQDRKSLRVPDPSDQVAKSIVEDYVSSQLGIDDNSKPAIFWIPDELSAGAILEKHGAEVLLNLKLQKNWMLNVVRIADNDWNRYHQHNVVSEFQRKCAEYIGWKADDHEWMNQPVTETVKCKACHSDAPLGAVVCPVCRAILDEEGAKARGIRFATV